MIAGRTLRKHSQKKLDWILLGELSGELRKQEFKFFFLYSKNPFQILNI
jgi:hypothetical protein